MAETKKPTSHKRVMDVSHPGKSTPSASSRPVIVTNRPILKDPMMLDETKKPDAEFPAKEVPRQVEIKPASAPVPEAEAAEVPKAAKTIAQLAEDAKARADKEAAPESVPVEKPVTDTKPEVESSDTVSPAAESAADEAAKIDETAKQDEALEKLVDSKQYFLPINSVEKRRTKRFVVLGVALSLILAVAWVDIALDAGIIQLSNVKPVTHFFSN